MPAVLNKSLESCEARAKELVEEIRKYQSARELNQKAAAALDKVSANLNRVVGDLKPLTVARFRIFVIVQTVTSLLTAAAVIALLVMAIRGNR